MHTRLEWKGSSVCHATLLKWNALLPHRSGLENIIEINNNLISLFKYFINYLIEFRE